MTAAETPTEPPSEPPSEPPPEPPPGPPIEPPSDSSRDGSDPRFRPAKVRAHAGHRGDEEPRSVADGDDRFRDVDVLDRWTETGPEAGSEVARSFRVRNAAGRVRILRCRPDGRWEIEAAESPRGA